MARTTVGKQEAHFSASRCRIALVALLVWASVALRAQTIALPGVVVIQNSEYETGKKIHVTDASIRAPFAKPVTTGKSGEFKLAFSGVANGTPVRLTVNRPGLEVVNSRDIGQVFLGRTTSLHIVMADPDKLAAAQVEYYNIATASITRTYTSRMAALRAENARLEDRLAQVTAETGQPAPTLEAAIELLTQQRQAGLQGAMEVAQYFAEVDLDGASQLYREAFAMLDRGEVDSVLSLLSQERLSEQYAQLNASKESAQELVATADKGIKQLFESYRLKETMLDIEMRWRERRDVLTEMKAIVTAHPTIFSAADHITVMHQSANLSIIEASFQDAIQELNGAWDLGTRALPAGDLLLGKIQASLSASYGWLGSTGPALKAAQRSLSIVTDALGTEDEALIAEYMIMGAALLGVHQDSAALEMFMHALRIAESDFQKNGHNIVEIHNILGTAHSRLGNIKEAMKSARNAQVMGERELPPDHIHLAQIYNNLATYMLEDGNYAEAKSMMERCLAIETKAYGSDHPTLAITYNNLAAVEFYLDNVPGALVLFKKVLFIRQQVGNPTAVGNVQANLGHLYVSISEFDSALVYLRASVVAQRGALDPEDPSLSNIYGKLGVCFAGMELLDSAYFYEEQNLRCALKGPEAPDGRAVSLAYFHLGNLANNAGDPAAAIGYFEHCRNARERTSGPQIPLVREVVLQLPLLYMNTDRADSAWAYVQWLKEYPSTDNSAEQAQLQTILGDLATFGGQLDSALGHYRAAHAHYATTGEEHDQEKRIVEQKLGITLGNIGMPDSAIHWLERSRSGASLNRDPAAERQRVQAAVALSWDLARVGKLDTALTLCEQLLPLQQRPNGSYIPEAGSTFIAMGWIKEQTGRLNEALADYRKGAAIDQRSLSPKHWDMARTHYYLGRTQYALKDRKAQAALESSAAIKATKDVAWYRYKLAMDRNDHTQALDQLVVFVRAPHWDFGAVPVDHDRVLADLKELATEKGRSDVLKEFHLE